MNLPKRVKTITSTHVGMSKFNQAVNTGKLFIKNNNDKKKTIGKTPSSHIIHLIGGE